MKIITQVENMANHKMVHHRRTQLSLNTALAIQEDTYGNVLLTICDPNATHAHRVQIFLPVDEAEDFLWELMNWYDGRATVFQGNLEDTI